MPLGFTYSFQRNKSGTVLSLFRHRVYIPL
nr:MAG TPA: hypothetical protein [Caudoviricetes sp.]